MSALLVAVVMIASVFAFAVRAIIPGQPGDAHGDEKNSIVEWAYGIGDVDRPLIIGWQDVHSLYSFNQRSKLV
jgi:hypothetical protein